MPSAIIDEAITLSRDKTSPMQYLNKILSHWRANGVTTVEESKKSALADIWQNQPSQNKTTPKNEIILK